MTMSKSQTPRRRRNIVQSMSDKKDDNNSGFKDQPQVNSSKQSEYELNNYADSYDQDNARLVEENIDFTNLDNDLDEDHGLHGDYWNVAVLLFLYTLQGIPLGLSQTIDFILQEKKVSFNDTMTIFSVLTFFVSSIAQL